MIFIDLNPAKSIDSRTRQIRISIVYLCMMVIKCHAMLRQTKKNFLFVEPLGIEIKEKKI